LVSLALITSEFDRNERIKKARLKSQATRATNDTRIAFSLKPLITNDLLSIVKLGEMEALNVSWNGLLALVLNVEGWNAWIASSCIEC
jgi:hypothetical protein